MFTAAQAPFTCTAAALMALQPIVVSLSKNSRGVFDYSIPMSNMLAELLKLGISTTLLVIQRVKSARAGRADDALLHEHAAREFGMFMIPGLIYFVNNNLLFYILQAREPLRRRTRAALRRSSALRRAQEIDPTTFQLLSQMKTIFTGILFRLFLKRRLTFIQWLALVTLACGTATSQLPSGRARRSHVIATGAALSMVSCLLSALGGAHPPVAHVALPSTRHARPSEPFSESPARRHLLGASAQGPRVRVDPLAEHAAIYMGRRLQRARCVHQEVRRARRRCWTAQRLRHRRVHRRRV